MESQTCESAPPNAPPYDEVMKYAIVPPAQMNPYPNDMLQQYQPQPVQPPVQHMQPTIQSNSHDPEPHHFIRLIVD